jgi:hypothetical protein
MKMSPGFTKKEFQVASDEYLKGLFGIKDTRKAGNKGANKGKLSGKPDCAGNDADAKKD